MLEYNGQMRPEYIRDITEQSVRRGTATSAARVFHKRFSASPAACRSPCLRMDGCWKVNSLFCGMTGFSRDEVIGRSTLALGLWATRARNRLMMAKPTREWGPRIFERSFGKKSGDSRCSACRDYPWERGRTPSLCCAGVFTNKSGEDALVKVIRASFIRTHAENGKYRAGVT